MPTFFQKARDPISSYSHFIGAGLSLLGLFVMALRFIVEDCTLITVLSSLLFCISLIALYSASGIYHFSQAGAKVIRILRKLDHAMIYVLIAGSYTPILLSILPPEKGIPFTIIIWSVALAGILFKLCWIGAPRWLGTLLYLAMGWAILIDPGALTNLSVPALTLLAAGGVFYTIGGIIYLFKYPNLSPVFGFHEIFHIFVVAGSICHYFMVFFFIA
ncbi:MAG: hemolysin III family protein [Oscillospiraceae bacterium]|nr:hemolysin III family protein [Oscillospiraceae bacterium]